ncbi:hypothetical protein LCGC14_1469840 [marine sediment metagenome]|uniref:Uncharacterized protein n=1 Tax=marine sediment metagenome TaxID=412755 RepID=A0A0F9MEI2_9ZZZZ
MATPTTIADAITQTALNPKSASTDKGRIEAHDIGDLLDALRHESAGTAAGKNHFGLRIVKLDFPGAG